MCFAIEFPTTVRLLYLYIHPILATVPGSVLKAALLCILQQVEVNTPLSIFHTDCVGKSKLHVSCTVSIIGNHCPRQGSLCENLTHAGKSPLGTAS